MARDFSALERTPRLLQRALTHGSATARREAHLESNERLEFLGDRVLGLVIAEMLYARFPQEPEGALAKRYAALVCREALVGVAEELLLGGHVIVSKSEEEGGGRHNESLLADACEAVIGAVFLDGGYEAARAFVRARWAGLLEADARPPQDPKTALQEWAQGQGLPLPVYQETARTGPAHAPAFTVRVEVKGLEGVSAEGSSKRAAERNAARLLLEKIAMGVHA
jgi:ribonuclease-3